MLLTARCAITSGFRASAHPEIQDSSNARAGVVGQPVVHRRHVPRHRARRGLGLVEGHRSAHDRFEVYGANAAWQFLAAHGVTGDALRIVWDSIALHTTPGIPQHKEPEVALVTAGVELDVLGFGYDDISAEDREAVLAAYPRVDFKESIIQAFADGMAHRPETVFGTMNADVLAEKLPGYEPPNFCALIRASKHTN
jgi:hypothetical protein